MRIGELTAAIPKATSASGNQYTGKWKKDTAVQNPKPVEPQPAASIVAEPRRVTVEPQPTPPPPKAQPAKPALRQTKADVIKEAGFTEKQVQRFEQLAKHPEIVQAAKVEARQNGDIVTRACWRHGAEL